MTADADDAIDRLFAPYPMARERFEEIRSFIATLGPVTVTGARSQVAFAARRKFAWVWLPQRVVRNRPDHAVALTFASDHEIDDPRIAEAVKVGAHRWTNHVMIEHPQDLDDTVRRWLREAYKWGSNGGFGDEHGSGHARD